MWWAHGKANGPIQPSVANAAMKKPIIRPTAASGIQDTPFSSSAWPMMKVAAVPQIPIT